MGHEDIWRAIDTLAAERGFSVSGLARAAGLDPTSFNPSKRRSRNGHPRWPSTESIAKILAVTGVPFNVFAELMAGARALPHSIRGGGQDQNVSIQAYVTPFEASVRIPVTRLVSTGMDNYFGDKGHPAGSGWERISLPWAPDPNTYGLMIYGSSLQPVYRDGDLVIAAPQQAPRIGDRVVVCLRDGEAMIKPLITLSRYQIELGCLCPAHGSRVVPTAKIIVLHRIIWISQ
jgi:phage repressor protein C with HTH and peptisase S24 domain